mmetsp:Transcript_38363/g.101805  ORF Transcript_38363/g.101805 Transcript_38363/m.101805 type:complete len:94 (+) Transcript_38363:184-465(+)
MNRRGRWHSRGFENSATCIGRQRDVEAGQDAGALTQTFLLAPGSRHAKQVLFWKLSFTRFSQLGRKNKSRIGMACLTFNFLVGETVGTGLLIA